MTRPTLPESMAEFDAAVREAGAAVGEAFAQSPVFRAVLRFSNWADTRFPLLGRIGDHAPRWMVFGTDQFWTLLIVLWLISAGLAVVAALVA